MLEGKDWCHWKPGHADIRQSTHKKIAYRWSLGGRWSSSWRSSLRDFRRGKTLWSCDSVIRRWPCGRPTIALWTWCPGCASAATPDVDREQRSSPARSHRRNATPCPALAAFTGFCKTRSIMIRRCSACSLLEIWSMVRVRARVRISHFIICLYIYSSLFTVNGSKQT